MIFRFIYLFLIMMPVWLPGNLLLAQESGNPVGSATTEEHGNVQSGENRGGAEPGENSVDAQSPGDRGSEAAMLGESVRSVGTVNGLIVEVGGDVIVEQFFDGMSVNRKTNAKSASKSILSLLIGIAIEEGYLEGVDQPIGSFFPEYFEEHSDSLKASITIQDLLTMRSGLETTSLEYYGTWVASSNWITYALDQPMVDRPGGRMIYSTGSTHLLSVLLTRASGMSTRAFARKYLFRPLGMEPGGWDRDPQGYYMGGNNLALSPAAFLKIGRMVMNIGSYDHRQIVPQEWIQESLRVYTRSIFNSYDYGYLWWRSKVRDYDLAFAWGYGGQYILMIPELDTVVVITSDLMKNDGSRRYQKELFRWLEQKLVPYLEDRISSDPFPAQIIFR